MAFFYIKLDNGKRLKTDSKRLRDLAVELKNRGIPVMFGIDDGEKIVRKIQIHSF